MLEMESRIYLLSGFTPLLGSQPPAPDVRTQYLASKATPEAAAEEEALTPDLDEKNLTVFLRDPDKNDRLIIMDYVVRGFLKEAFTSLKAQVGVGNARSKIDRYVFVEPRRIPIRKDGKAVYDEDDYFERPIRCQTMCVNFRRYCSISGTIATALTAGMASTPQTPSRRSSARTG